MHTKLKIFGVITSIGMLIVLLQGALVTKTESGDGCGATWPFCLGKILPPSPTTETIIEYSHRAVSGLVGLMIIVFSILAWRAIPHIRETKLMAILSVFFIAFQGLLGAGAVVFGQSDAVLALHFGISSLSLTVVILLTVLVFEDGKASVVQPVVSKGFRNYVIFALVYVYLVIYSGAYVKHTRTTYACGPEFPTCNGELIPQLTASIFPHYLHRLAGIATFFIILIMLIWAIRKYRHEPTILWGSIIAFILVTMQLVSGIYVVLTYNTLAFSLLHALIIALLFATLCYLMMVISRKGFSPSPKTIKNELLAE